MLKNTKTLRELQEEVDEGKAVDNNGLTASLK